MRKLFTFVAALLLLSGCSGQEVLNRLTTDEGYQLASNIVFDEANNLALDVYSPANTKNAPVVIFFFGGRWEEGDKSQYKFVGQALAARGFVAVLPNYRLYPRVKFPGFLTDNARAVRWVHNNAAKYGADPDKIVLMGHSAGAYNAAMLAMNPEYLKAGGADRAWVRGMIGLSGPYDFLPITDPDLRDLFGPPESFELTQPVLYADGRNPPMLLMHGEDDDTVFAKNTHSLAARIQKAGGPVETVFYPKMSHSKIIASVATATVARVAVGETDVMFYVADFVKRVTSGGAQKTPSQSGLQTTVPPP